MKVLFVIAIIAFVVVAKITAEECSFDCDSATGHLVETVDGEKRCCDPTKFDVLAVGRDDDQDIHHCECLSLDK
ncbi:hypothetical protein RRG08_035013 [Elysia crispata]|uniref:Uncharacterized protein n=1 Tax=Elysia crispata TaxID=231223 RepID=A0AAE1DM86_9GAST|nr:hypothetical protein RRG08_035013 [Elysia crispata]